MGREASAGTKLFFKPEEHDVFPSAGGWMAGFGKTCSFQEGTSEDAQDTSGWHIPSLCSPSGQTESQELSECRDQTPASDLAHKPVTACFYLLPNICLH